MLRSACIFLAAILLPSLVLAWLAIRSARDQQVLVEHQQAIISQDVTDSLAKNIRNQIDGVRSEFVQATQDMLSKSATPLAAADDFDRQLRDVWNLGEVGFAVNLHGTIYSPNRTQDPAARTFLEENERFLSNRENAEVYSSLNSSTYVAQQPAELKKVAVSGGAATTVAPTDKAQEPQGGLAAKSSLRAPTDSLEAQMQKAAAKASPASDSDSLLPTPSSQDSAGAAISGSMHAFRQATLPEEKSTPADRTRNASMESNSTAGQVLADLPQAQGRLASISPPPSSTASTGTESTIADLQLQTKLAQKISQVARNVSPQNNFNAATAQLSNTIPEESDFRKLIGDDTSGAIARFLDNKLQLLVWFRSSSASDLVFGAQLNQVRLLERLRSVLQAPEFKERDNYLPSRNSTPTYCLALLDDMGRPVATSISGFSTDWKQPFVATEIGETLPHWEAALYLTDPQQLSRSARTLRFTIGLIVILLVIAIAIGGSLIAADIRRQVRVAQQKTDFVSNVSHELKTPLTSIRMFADLLAEGRVTEPERQLTYLKIISAESARLTRLINNVLDFARQERGISVGERRACDLIETTRDVVETCLPHLEASGQNLTCEIETETLPIVGDRDAFAQIVLNLISNAEKYGGGEILVRIRRQDTPSGALGCVDVLDLGPGIPPKEVESIFLPFHRLHDSLANGIPGSGLGLTLARRMARVHGGNITYSPRAGGGSCFTLTMPLTS